ncbi:tellurite resistance/C4-dicarboxylate transporter family protein [Streptomyces sp. LP11]|uniref:Tellurite resistance/C4-dicarboxylate transporter family protein n=1 Tax=Streptomyces pyxinicus TaxID=2970331 RepID=A0ABT2AV64_9ACTN|nr:tellurite resistance/C4-dicarboxylate transporter family protein [Streptomyces sp. LP11]MCS0600137.1 tellurite resistance/C4-dicarboxylate transporter family protein [Streptomyces sp. LP11]
MPGISALRAWWAGRSPVAGSAVMATGIVSVGLRSAGAETLSLVVLAVACGAWVVLAAGFVLRLVGERSRWLAEARGPGALTAVAATTVLGTALSLAGGQTAAGVLLALAALLWPGLLVLAVRHAGALMPGSVFLCCVATQGLAVLGATLAAAVQTAWLAHTALVLFWLGLLLYGFALTRFDRRQVLEGPGDHWVAGGALAISALAGSKLLAAADGSMYLWDADDRGVLRLVTSALLVLSLAGYVLLLAAEAFRPRPGYDFRRWSTVFPMGMTAAATLSAAAVLPVPWLRVPGEVLVWVAVAAWLVVAAGAVRAVRAGENAG